MPYKAKLKTPSLHPRKKALYKVTNWSEYNKSLMRRGEVSLYFPYGDLKSLFINDAAYISGVSGQQSTYKAPYIELIFLFYRLLGWGLRQTTGYFTDLWRSKKLDIPVPSFGHLSDLFSALPIKVQQRCDALALKIKRGEPVTLIVDSTGMRFDKASSWYETKYGKPNLQKPWRKLHLSIDRDMNIHNVDITETSVSDHDIMHDFIHQNKTMCIDNIVADGAYYRKETGEMLYRNGIIPVIPPPSHAVVQGGEETQWHDKIVQYIKDKGTVYAFHKKYGYGVRALVEAQISRIKRCIGDTLKTQKIESQKREGVIIANIINTWNSFGKCMAVKQ